MDVGKNCDNCMWNDNPVQGLEPCGFWETCMSNNMCHFEPAPPTSTAKFVQWIKKVFGRA